MGILGNQVVYIKRGLNKWSFFKIFFNRGKRRINDNRGVHIASGKNVCDCLEEGCAGCFFPCPKCGSQMCGVECRSVSKVLHLNKQKFMYL